MRKISANYIFAESGKWLKNGIIHLNDENIITKVQHTEGVLQEEANLEFYNGVLCPAFVNTHCHLELSHLKHNIQKHTSLPDFINQIHKKRNAESATILKAARSADSLMFANGIVAVGDIVNNETVIEIKKNSKIRYISFLETFGLNEALIEERWENTLALLKLYENSHLEASIVPHAPYSVPDVLLKKITDFATANNGIISFHNQETESENSLFQNETGILVESFREWGLSVAGISGRGKNSLPNILTKLPAGLHTLLVHNTFTTEDDILQATNYFQNLFWVFCPNANLYIENKLPNVSLFTKHNQTITIGTDSFASNSNLSVLEELKTLQRFFPEISTNELLTWATINGAKALKIENRFGTFQEGKQSGVNLITPFNFKEMKLLPESKIQRLV